MQIPTVKATRRQTSGTKHNRKLRAQGQTPGVLYGRGQDNINIALDALAVDGLIANTVHVVELDVEGARAHALVRAVQRDSLGNNIEHVDFTRLELDDEVRVILPLHFVGTAKGSQHGGVLQVMRGEIPLSCKARNIPKHVEHDITNLDLDEYVRYKDIKLPEGAKLAANADWLVASCREPRVVEIAPTPAEAAAAAAAAGAVPGAPGAVPAAGAVPGAPGAAPAAGAKGAAPAAGAKGAAPAAASPAKGAAPAGKK